MTLIAIDYEQKDHDSLTHFGERRRGLYVRRCVHKYVCVSPPRAHVAFVTSQRTGLYVVGIWWLQLYPFVIDEIKLLPSLEMTIVEQYQPFEITGPCRAKQHIPI